MLVDEVCCFADGGVYLLVAELPHSAVFVVVHYHRVIGALLRVKSEQFGNGFFAVEGWAGPGRAVDTLLGPDCQSFGRVHGEELVKEGGVGMYSFTVRPQIICFLVPGYLRLMHPPRGQSASRRVGKPYVTGRCSMRCAAALLCQ